jgi:hypothetical protein
VLLNNNELYNLAVSVIILIGFFAFAIWYLVDVYRFRKYDGKMRRGVKISSRELPINILQHLQKIRTDEVSVKGLSIFPQEFVRVEPDGILIFSSPEKFTSTWICVGFIDLTLPFPELEYRMSLAGLVFLVPFTIFGVLIFAVSFIQYKKAIDAFIERNVNTTI